jgi:hypothetical protein
MAASDPAVSPRDLIAPASIAALWAAAFGVVIAALPVLLIWTLGASGAGSLTVAIKAALLAWPISHGVPISITLVSVDVLPLLVVIFPIFLMRRAAIRIFRIVEPQLGLIMAIAIPVILVNTAISFLLAWLASGDVIAISPIQTVIVVVVISTVAVALGAIKVYGFPKLEIPQSINLGLRVGLLISVLLISAASVLVLVMLGINISNANEVAISVADTRTEKILIWLLTLGYFPVAVSWGYSWLLGPGVATGVDTASSFAVIDQAALPAIPWLAALPAATPENGWYVLIIPVLLAAFFALLLWWSLHNESYRIIFTNSLMALTTITAFAVLLSIIGGGSIGPGRLAVFGPQWLPVIGGAVVTMAPAFGLLLILESIRRGIKAKVARKQIDA